MAGGGGGRGGGWRNGGCFFQKGKWHFIKDVADLCVQALINNPALNMALFAGGGAQNHPLESLCKTAADPAVM